MLFSSISFLWYFLPIVLAGNFLLSLIPADRQQGRLRIKLKNIWLLVASLVFYAWGSINYLFIMLVSICINYVSALLLNQCSVTAREKCVNKTKLHRFILIVCIAANLGILFYFKYLNFFVGMLQSISNSSFGLKEVVLPIGISFYTFQTMSYVIDVYRGNVKVQKNILSLALYTSLFPQLIAGPIVKYKDICAEIEYRRESPQLFFKGIRLFCFGLGKKVLLANAFAEVVDKIFAFDVSTIGTKIAWLGIVLYALQIYFDFSGYSDMAIGLGRMFGFHFLKNFDYPYLSSSIQKFWRRWHISLSSWFKEYVYIPLGGSRKGLPRTCINTLIVFALTGIWHGADYTFIVWGLFYGVLLVAERLFLGELLKKNPLKIVNWLYVILVTLVAWVFFRADSITYALSYLQQMFTSNQSDILLVALMSKYTWIAMGVGIVLSLGLQCVLLPSFNKLKKNAVGKSILLCVEFVFEMVLLLWCISSLISDSYNPFIYFRF